MSENTVSNKSALAKLLAKEDITVVHENVQTASFNLKTRTLTLPIWDNMSDELYDLMVGHEVGHALFTPEEGWHDAVVPKGPVFRGFLNVIEDARIERMIKVVYPGLVKQFSAGYVDLMQREFFGIKSADELNAKSFIDRINVYAKAGIKSKVEFSDEEWSWVDRIDSLETWEDVESYTEELYEYCGRQNAENEDAKTQQGDEGEDGESEQVEVPTFGEESEEESGEESEETKSEADGEDGEEGEESSEKSDADGEEGEESSEKSDADGEEGEDGEASGEDGEESGEEGKESEDDDSETGDGDIDPESNPDSWGEPDAPTTDEALREALEKLSTGSDYARVYNVEIPKYKDINKRIVSYKKIFELAVCDFSWGSDDKPAAVSCDSPDWDYDYAKQNVTNLKEDALPIGRGFFGSIKKSLQHMVREFEMRKSAHEYARTTVSKTGVIDPVAMNTYKYNDDIFKKVSCVPDGKNHGFVMYLDWSGSMSSMCADAFTQVALLAHFCKKISVPFRVYAFTDKSCLAKVTTYDVGDITYKMGDLVPTDDLRLLELYSENMSMNEMFTMTGILLCNTLSEFSYRNKNMNTWARVCPWWNKVSGRAYWQSPFLGLSATPLDSTLLLAPQIHNQFKANNRLDIVNTIVVTDGDSHQCQMMYEENKVSTVGSPGYSKKYFLKNAKGRTTPVKNWTKSLVENYKAVTDSTTICYYITPRATECKVSEGWKSVGALRGYDDYIYINQCILNGAASHNDFLDKDTDTTSTKGRGKLLTAVKKAGKANKLHRSLLTRIITQVA